ncbi:MAG: hypothetical protein ACM3X9_09860 [Bacillota bacterium]
MKLIIAGWIAIGLALLWDRVLYFCGVNETLRVGILAPLGEEFLKWGVSFYYQLSPLFLYAFFGLGEGIYELIHSNKPLKWFLVPAGVLQHTAFGTFFLFKMPVWLSLSLAIVSHLFWNGMILRRHSWRRFK